MVEHAEASDEDRNQVASRIKELKMAVAAAVAEEDFELVTSLGAELRKLKMSHDSMSAWVLMKSCSATAAEVAMKAAIAARIAAMRADKALDSVRSWADVDRMTVSATARLDGAARTLAATLQTREMVLESHQSGTAQVAEHFDKLKAAALGKLDSDNDAKLQALDAQAATLQGIQADTNRICEVLAGMKENGAGRKELKASDEVRDLHRMESTVAALEPCANATFGVLSKILQACSQMEEAMVLHGKTGASVTAAANAPPAAANCTAVGPGVSSASVGDKTEFVIALVDKHGAACCSAGLSSRILAGGVLSVSARRAPGPTAGWVGRAMVDDRLPPMSDRIAVSKLDNADGSFTCSYTPADGSVVRVDVVVAGQHVPGSPFAMVPMDVSCTPWGWTTVGREISISEDGLLVTMHSWGAERLMTGGPVMTSGKFFWEVELPKKDGSGVWVNVGAVRPGLDHDMSHSGSVDAYFMNAQTGGIFGDGLHNGAPQGQFNPGDRVGCLLDLDAGSLRFFRNGQACGDGFTNGVRGPLVRGVQLTSGGDTVLILPHALPPNEETFA